MSFKCAKSKPLSLTLVLFPILPFSLSLVLSLFSLFLFVSPSHCLFLSLPKECMSRKYWHRPPRKPRLPIEAPCARAKKEAQRKKKKKKGKEANPRNPGEPRTKKPCRGGGYPAKFDRPLSPIGPSARARPENVRWNFYFPRAGARPIARSSH